MDTDWLCTAITRVGASHTEHLGQTKRARLKPTSTANESDSTPAVHRPGYVFGNVRAQDRRHHQRHRFGRAQPVAVIVPARVVAHFVQVAEQERHGVELFQTTARRTFSKTRRYARTSGGLVRTRSGHGRFDGARKNGFAPDERFLGSLLGPLVPKHFPKWSCAERSGIVVPREFRAGVGGRERLRSIWFCIIFPVQFFTFRITIAGLMFGFIAARNTIH